ncbi:MAG: hypothetical protein E7509_05825 [Ruminococcus sp.]|nr:hypothetical protein [Ruminococcus sp.]
MKLNLSRELNEKIKKLDMEYELKNKEKFYCKVKAPKSFLSFIKWLVIFAVANIIALVVPAKIDTGMKFTFISSLVLCLIGVLLFALIYFNFEINYDADGFTHTNMLGISKKYFYDDINYVKSGTLNGNTSNVIVFKNNKKISFSSSFYGAKEFYEYLKIKNKI